MFREGETKQGFHCMDCGKPLPDREIICKDCLKKHRKNREHFQVTRLPAHERMESL